MRSHLPRLPRRKPDAGRTALLTALRILANSVAYIALGFAVIAVANTVVSPEWRPVVRFVIFVGAVFTVQVALVIRARKRRRRG